MVHFCLVEHLFRRSEWPEIFRFNCDEKLRFSFAKYYLRFSNMGKLINFISVFGRANMSFRVRTSK